MSYTTKAVRGAAAVTTAFAGQQAISLVVNIILARLLLRSDFGVVALVLAITSLLDVFAELGVGVALVQKKDLHEHTIDTAFTATITSTFLISTLLFIFSNSVGTFYHSTVLPDLLRIAAISFIFKGNYAVYRCLMLRDMRYGVVSHNALTSSAVYGLVAVILAYMHFGPYSLVIALTISNLLLFCLGMWATRVYPRLYIDMTELRSLLGFGLWVSLGRVLGNAAGKVDSFVIGKALDMTSLGVYNVAQRIVLIIPQVITQALDQVTYPIYAKMQDTPERIEETYWNTLSMISMVSMPAISLLFLVSDPLIPMLFGDKWASSVPIARIMCIFSAASCVGGGIFASIIYASGKPKWATVMNIFRILTLPAFIIVGSRWGVVGVTWGFSIWGIIGRIFNQYILHREFGYSINRYFKIAAAPVAMNVSATAFVMLIANTFWPTPSTHTHWGLRCLWVLSISILWAGLYSGLWAVFMKENFIKTTTLLKSAISAKSSV